VVEGLEGAENRGKSHKIGPTESSAQLRAISMPYFCGRRVFVCVCHANLLIAMKTSLGAIGIKNKYISRCVGCAELKRNKEFNYNALFVT